MMRVSTVQSVAPLIATIAIAAGCSSSSREANVVARDFTFNWNVVQASPQVRTMEVEFGGRKDTVTMQDAGTPAFRNNIVWLKGHSAAFGIDIRAVRAGTETRATYFLPNGFVVSQLIRGERLVSQFAKTAATDILCLIRPLQERERPDPRPRMVAMQALKVNAGNGLGGMHSTYSIAPILTGKLADAVGGQPSGTIDHQELLSFTDALINSANFILEREIAVSLRPVEIDGAYPKLSTQNSFTGDAEALAGKANDIAKSAKVDLAHLIEQGTGPSGWAEIASTCGAGKAKAATIGVGITDGQYLDTFVHEVGHQLGAHHSFNGPGRSEFNVGYEPGDGVTLMTHHVLRETFHAASLTQMFTYLMAQGPTCGTGNTAPKAPTLGAALSKPEPVPVRTAFAINAEPDNTATCGRIDEFDPGLAENSTPPFFEADSGCEFARSFPDEPRNIALTKLPAQLPSAKTTLHFRAMAWSGSTGPRPLASADSAVEFIETTPFTVTEVNPSCNYAAGSKMKIAWDPSGILPAPFNADKLVADLVYQNASVPPQELAHDIPVSSKTAELLLPKGTGRARIKLTPSPGIYFAVSDWFDIQPAGACTTSATPKPE